MPVSGWPMPTEQTRSRCRRKAIGLTAWSQDSSRLIFSAVTILSGVSEEYIVQADGSGLRHVGTVSVGIYLRSGPPIWAPNGKLVLFFGEPVAVIDADSGTTADFDVPIGHAQGAPAWSGDSKKIVYAIPGEPEDVGIFVIDVESGETTKIDVDGIPNGPIAVSADGERIAYFLDDNVNVGMQDLHIINIDGTGDSLVLRGVTNFTAPAFSPDGERLAVIVAKGEARGLHVVGADGSGDRQLTRSGYFNSIRWADNDRLVLNTFIGGL